MVSRFLLSMRSIMEVFFRPFLKVIIIISLSGSISNEKVELEPQSCKEYFQAHMDAHKNLKKNIKTAVKVISLPLKMAAVIAANY